MTNGYNYAIMIIGIKGGYKEMTENIQTDFLPPPRHGFVAGVCKKCGKTTFSKGKVNKHKCK